MDATASGARVNATGENAAIEAVAAPVTGPPQAAPATAIVAPAATGPAALVLGGLSLSHLLNDMIQSLLPAIYPLLKQSYALDFAQIGVLTLAFQLTASLLQPVVGLVTDKRPMPFSLAAGMLLSLCGLLLLSHAGTYGLLILAACCVGLGSAIFHPEASRVARLASGGRYGLAQSVFQVGGNAGSALGPLLAAFIVVPLGQASVALFAVAALAGFVVLSLVGRWYRERLRTGAARPRKAGAGGRDLPRGKVVATIAVLLVLIFSKYFYMASLSSYFTFYLIHRFGVSVQESQLYLFVFLGAVAAGTVAGGPIGDRFGRKVVIWGSILGVLPFTLALPHANLFWTVALTVPIGLILASAMPAILVYAQELLPGRVGLVGGLFFGFAFGMGGLGAAVLGEVADRTSIEFVYGLCAFLPAVGLLAAFLPRLEAPRAA
ncbi:MULTISPECIES: MFS transporter [Methylobacterium]|jgi:FSR family fosmidomycin resistance protein-like MFS transporter|uniref:MFS transporter n=1 Tax=Methylobacterium TaxID=407 RepID=UPI0008E6BE96|nr:MULTISPECIES: MFS transporter [Methylobacterium]MBK3398384.1 MFS transporter [Methylobacterium ajmalii]MBK3409004.1 MFS transporter [Methylobacterium ajmalii]MBZ6413483.1 MFS transporter [Methylobacterium sp.]SFF50566.1 MFS transporter, FSR family, fosmidomycin resistance protein [Methylobacterium sp. yr596]